MSFTKERNNNVFKVRKIGTLVTWLIGMSNDAGVLENVLMSPQKAKFKINI